MKILVTGAGGFLGSRLAAAVLAGAPGVPAASTVAVGRRTRGLVAGRKVIDA
jgi:nucleoside-diphosphate-sugar epimerase